MKSQADLRREILALGSKAEALLDDRTKSMTIKRAEPRQIKAEIDGKAHDLNLVTSDGDIDRGDVATFRPTGSRVRGARSSVPSLVPTISFRPSIWTRAYLDEFAFRFNSRENPYLFCDTLIKLCPADVLPYKVLTQSATGGS